MTGTEGEPYVGRPILRREDRRLLTGRGLFVDNLSQQGMAHVAFVRSPHAHAVVRGIDSSSADALLVLTAADTAHAAALPIQPVEGAELADAGHPVLARDEVRYVGQPVAAVVAETRALAIDAAQLVEVDYEQLEAVLDPAASRHVLMHWSRTAGDVEGAFADAADVVAQSFSVPRVAAAPLEPRAAVASYDDDADLLTIWVSAQDPHRQRAGLAHVLRREQDSIRVIVPDVGGSFGSKGSVSPETCAVALCAMRLGRPVKWTEDRSENLVAAQHGRGLTAHAELALDTHGRMLALRASIRADLGAFLLPATAIPPHTAANSLSGCYAIPAMAVEVTGIETNRVPTGPCRGAGRPEATYIIERLVDEAAVRFGLDPIRARRLNLIRSESLPYTTPFGSTYDSGDYGRCLDVALAAARPEQRIEADSVIGTGVALHVSRSGGLWERACVRPYADGRIEVACGVCPHGQGHETALAQIAADELHLPIDQIVLRFGDSRDGVDGVGTFASRSITMGGTAVRNACRDLIAEAERVSGTSWPDMSPRHLEGIAGHGFFQSQPVFPSGCCVAVVHIDLATGALKVLRLVAADDGGRIVNPLLAEAQVVGGLVQALGECTCANPRFEELGSSTSADIVHYAIPAARDVPPITTRFVASPSPLNPLGAKGVGEAGTIGAFAAIANAVADAVGRHVDPPFTPERIWRALRVTGTGRT